MAVLGALLLGACTAKLQVEVSVLDPDYLDEFRRAAPIEAVERQARLAEAALADDGQLGQAAIDKATALEARANALDAKLREANLIAADTQLLGVSIRRFAESGLNEARAELRKGIDAVRGARALPPDKLREALAGYRAAFEAFEKARETLANIDSDLRAEFSQAARVAGQSPDARVEFDALSVDTFKLVNLAVQTTSRIDDTGTLRGDPLLGYVVRAPEDGWRGVFNEAFATSSGSNADVAIVMDDIDKFSVKGLRADSSAATKATFATLGTVMSIAAAVSGVPVSGLIQAPPTQPEGEGTGEQQAAMEQQLIVSRAELRARSQNARIDMIRLMNSITAEGTAILDSADGAQIDDGARGRISIRLESASK